VLLLVTLASCVTLTKAQSPSSALTSFSNSAGEHVYYLDGQADHATTASNGEVASPNVLFGQATRGVVFYTAAINGDGSVASCFNCNKALTFRVSPGVYQVDFGKNVQAINGFSRWVQPDTFRTVPGFSFCDTGYAAGDVNAVSVNCLDASGTPIDTTFFLFVAR